MPSVPLKLESVWSRVQHRLSPIQTILDSSPVLKTSYQQVFLSSDFVLDTALAQPGWLKELVQREISQWLDVDYVCMLKSTLESVATQEELMQVLRAFRQRECARIAWGDLAGWLSYAQVAQALTSLAGVIVRETLAFLEQTFFPQAVGLMVLALGKLGAEELNFSSDIDVMFVYPDEGESRLATYRALAQTWVKVLSQVTRDGFVYRVDLRLRPFGQAGALVFNISALAHYYQTQGRAWERYALMRARVLTGQRSEIRKLMAHLQPFVYRPYFDYSTQQVIRDLRAQIAAQAKQKRHHDHVKLGPGGIREVEFIVQSQLLLYGFQPSLQEHRLLPAFSLLEKKRLLGRDDVALLKKAYLFLRTLENRLQMMRDQQVGQLPTESVAQIRLALSMGYKSFDEVYEAYTCHTQFVRGLFNRVLAAPNEISSVGRSEVVKPSSDELAQNITQLEKRINSQRFDQEVKQKAVLLLKWLRSQGNEFHEDAQQLGIKLIDQLLGRKTYLNLLAEHPTVFRESVRLMQASEWVADAILQFPALLSQIFARDHIKPPLEGGALARELDSVCEGIEYDNVELLMGELRRFKRSMTLRIAAADLAGRLPLMRVSDHLTALAEVILAKVFHYAWQGALVKFGVASAMNTPIAHMAIVAYGKLGGIELSYSSDLDLVFIYDEQALGPPQVVPKVSMTKLYMSVVQKMLHFLTTKTYSGVLYDVDLRLRPSGQSGLLVTTLEAFERYQETQAWTWEHQALLRTRAICGQVGLCQRFDVMRQRILTQPRAIAELKRDVLAMRQRIQDNLKPDEQKALKYIPGGIVDIEFIVQFLALAYGAQCPEMVKWSDNIRVLDEAAKAGVLDKADVQTLHQAYCNFREQLHRQALNPSQHNVVPFEEEAKAVRHVFDRVMLSS